MIRSIANSLNTHLPVFLAQHKASVITSIATAALSYLATSSASAALIVGVVAGIAVYLLSKIANAFDRAFSSADRGGFTLPTAGTPRGYGSRPAPESAYATPPTARRPLFTATPRGHGRANIPTRPPVPTPSRPPRPPSPHLNGIAAQGARVPLAGPPPQSRLRHEQPPAQVIFAPPPVSTPAKTPARALHFTHQTPKPALVLPAGIPGLLQTPVAGLPGMGAPFPPPFAPRTATAQPAFQSPAPPLAGIPNPTKPVPQQAPVVASSFLRQQPSTYKTGGFFSRFADMGGPPPDPFAASAQPPSPNISPLRGLPPTTKR